MGLPMPAATAAVASGALPNVRWGKLDVDEAGETAEAYNVEALPTILAVRGDKYWSYEGPRRASSLDNLCTKTASPPKL